MNSSPRDYINKGQHIFFCNRGVAIDGKVMTILRREGVERYVAKNHARCFVLVGTPRELVAGNRTLETLPGVDFCGIVFLNACPLR